MDPSRSSLEAALALVRRAYIVGLAARLQALEAAVQSLPADPVGAQQLLRRQAHALRGSGATFGFPRISETARRAEGAATGPVDPVALTEAVGALVQSLRDAAASEGATP